MLKLYYSPASCSLAPHIVLKELGIPYQLVRVDLKKKTSEEGDYYKSNPKGSVPAIEYEKGKILTEAAVLLQYLADLKPELGLAPPSSSFERYRLQEWLNFIATEMHKGFSPLWNSQFPAEGKKIAQDNLTKRFEILESHFKTSPFLMGPKFSVADAYLFTVMNWAFLLKISLSPWPQLLAYVEKIRERPSVQEVLKAEGLLKAA